MPKEPDKLRQPFMRDQEFWEHCFIASLAAGDGPLAAAEQADRAVDRRAISIANYNQRVLSDVPTEQTP